MAGFEFMMSRAPFVDFCNSMQQVSGISAKDLPEPPTTLALRGQFKSVLELIGSYKRLDIASAPDCGETWRRTEDHLLATVSDFSLNNSEV